MGRTKHRKRAHSISSSSSSSSEGKRFKSKLKEKKRRIKSLEGLVKQLRKKELSVRSGTPPLPTVLTPKTTNNEVRPVVRYVGRNDFVPEFNPQTSSVSVEHWIRNLESTSKMHGWDERTLICNCTSKLSGYAKTWYEQQASYEISWEEWKEKLIKAFPFTKNKLSQIRELVNRVKLPEEDPIEFYYTKLGIGMSCQLSDEVITEAIIGTLGNTLLEVGAKSAGCRNTSTLLQYLASINSADLSKENVQPSTSKQSDSGSSKLLKCFSCGKTGHKANRCYKNKGTKKSTQSQNKNFGIKKCSYCDRAGHTENDCYKKKNQKHCTFCDIKGHSLEECRKRSRASPQNKLVRKVHSVCPDFSDKKYFKTVLVNQNPAEGFIDFGSSCNAMTQSFCKKHGLDCTPSDDSVIKGFGDGIVIPIGITSATLSVDGLDMKTQFFVVQNQVQNFDILVGQPFTEAKDIVVVKTSTQLSFLKRNMFLGLAELCEEIEKVRLYPNDDVVLNPGLNKIIVRTEPLSIGVMRVKHSEHRRPLHERDILSEEVESKDGSTIIKLVNRTNSLIGLNKEECIARAQMKTVDEEVLNSPKIGDHLTEEERKLLDSLLEKHEECFAKNGMELGNCSIQMCIKLTEEKVINYKPYRMSFHEREIVRKIVTELLNAGIIEASTSAYASPVLLVKKKDGGHRMCVDYRALNKVTVKERFPLPIIQDLLDRLVDKTMFCCLDLANGYHQIKIAAESRPYTGFVTPDGHYQYRMMSFGLCNAPAVFQRAMNEILAPVIHSCAEVYIDDVIVWGNDFSDCLENLRRTLELIHAAGVKLKRSKCSFLTKTVEYLGHQIQEGEIRPSSHKVAAVADFRTPDNVHELRQFLGLANYFRKFIKGFSTIAKPLTILTKKNVEWRWGDEQSIAMETLKRALTSDPVLAIYNPNRETQIHTDASKLGLGGVLLQRPENGEWKAVAYASRQTTPTEVNYHSFELEALAVVFSIQKFKVYVTGIKFCVVTDCSALRLAWAKRDLSPRIARWWLDLQEFDFEVEHRPGTSMTHVDALSRNPISILHIEEKDFIYALQDVDEEVQSTMANLKLELDANKQKKDGLSKDFKVVNGLLCRVVNNATRPVLPKNARWHIMKTYHDNNGHLGVEKCLEAIQAKYWFPKMRRRVERYVSSCIGCQFSKKPTGKQPGLLHPISRKPVPFDTLHVDHLGPFCKSNGKAYIFAVIDGFTKFVWIEAVASPNAKGAIAALNKLSQVFGYPARIISDRGSAFTGREFEDYCSELGIKHVLNAVATPRANGQVERLNRTILNSLSAYMGEDQKGWDKYLPKVQLGINSMVSQGTGKSPLELLCGLRPRLAGDVQGALYAPSDLSQYREQATQKIAENAERMKLRYNKSRRASPPIAVGSLVMVERKIIRPGLTSGKLVPKYAGPYKITAVLPNDRYEVTSAARGKKAYKSIAARDKLKVWHARCESSSDEDQTDQS